jgi:hypothetical protein
MKKIITFFAFILFTGTAWADVPSSAQTYVTWGDFDVVVNTFERVALMVSDSTYHGLFFGIIVISLVFGILSSFGRGFLTGQANPMAWIQVFGTIIIGVIIYQTFIQKTSQIVIYDETLNLQKTVADVPDGLILLAGISRKIEKGLVDIIWTSSDPYSYKEAAGGSIFNILKSAYGKNVNLNGLPNGGEYIKRSLQSYIDKCLWYEMARPGTAIDVNDFNNTVNLEGILALAQSDSINAVIYNGTYKSGLTGTCTECWTEINNYLTTLTPTSPEVERFYTETAGIAGVLNVVGATGIDVDLTSANKVTAFISALLGTSVSKSQVVTQKLIADELWTAVNNGDSTAVANRKTGVSMSGMANMANDWIPILKSLVFAIFIGLFPFICLLIPTPLFGRAISFMFGSFVFLTAWGICDALIHSFAMDKAIALFREVATSGLGMNSHLMFESESSKALAMFGAARWSSMMLAGVLSAMIARFGGYAMAQFSSQMSMAKMHGAEAETMVSSPEGRARELNALESSMPSQALSNEYGMNQMSQIDMFRKGSALQADKKLIGEWGGGDVSTAMTKSADNRAVNAVADEARTDELGMEGARRSGQNAGIRARETSKGDQRFLDEYSDTLADKEYHDQVKSTATSYADMGIAEQVGNGEISEGTKGALNKLDEDTYGRKGLQDGGSHVFAVVSKTEATGISDLAHDSGFGDINVKEGDRAAVSTMYDSENGTFVASNVGGTHKGQEDRGQIKMETNKQIVENADQTGLHKEIKTLNGQTVLLQEDSGERINTSFTDISGNKVDSSSSNVSGNLKTINDNVVTHRAGVDAYKSVASNLVYKTALAKLPDGPNKEMTAYEITGATMGAARDSSLVSQFANPFTSAAGLSLLGAEGLTNEHLQEAFKEFKTEETKQMDYDLRSDRFGKSLWN